MLKICQTAGTLMVLLSFQECLLPTNARADLQSQFQKVQVSWICLFYGTYFFPSFNASQTKLICCFRTKHNCSDNYLITIAKYFEIYPKMTKQNCLGFFSLQNVPFLFPDFNALPNINVSVSGDDESSTDAGGGFVVAETVGHYIDEHGNQVCLYHPVSQIMNPS